MSAKRTKPTAPAPVAAPAAETAHGAPEPPTDAEPLAVRYVELETLRPAHRNARTHSEAQIEQIATAIRNFGFTNPLLVDEQQQIIAGHGRLAAAKKIGLARVPVIELRGLTAAGKRALALADNRIAQNSGWDEDTLRIELQDLNDDGTVDLETLGFDNREILKLLNITGAPPPPEGVNYKSMFSVVVNVDSEAAQIKLLERLSAEGYECKALIA